ncbi:MAG: SPFH domain-containing protein, partial [Fulvivirga sp.]
MKTEKDNNPVSGYLMIFVVTILFFGSILLLAATKFPMFALGIVASLVLCPGFFFVNPNGSRVLVLFGDYKGTVKKNGFFWVNPFYVKKKISLRARNFDSERVKVNDKVGNPILIGVILVWQVEDTFKAAFEVDNYENFVRVQSDAAVRKLAGQYPYDNFEDGDAEMTLRSGLDEVNHALEENLTQRLDIA